MCERQREDSKICNKSFTNYLRGGNSIVDWPVKIIIGSYHVFSNHTELRRKKWKHLDYCSSFSLFSAP